MIRESVVEASTYDKAEREVYRNWEASEDISISISTLPSRWSEFHILYSCPSKGCRKRQLTPCMVPANEGRIYDLFYLSVKNKYIKSEHC